MIQEPDLKTIPEAAKLLRCSERTVYNLIDRGELQAVMVTSLRRIPIQAIADYIDRNTTRLSQSLTRPRGRPRKIAPGA